MEIYYKSLEQLDNYKKFVKSNAEINQLNLELKKAER